MKRLYLALIQHSLEVGESELHEMGGGTTFRHLGYKDCPYSSLSKDEYHELIRLADIGLTFLRLKNAYKVGGDEKIVRCTNCSNEMKAGDAHYLSVVQRGELYEVVLCDDCYQRGKLS